MSLVDEHFKLFNASSTITNEQPEVANEQTEVMANELLITSFKL